MSLAARVEAANRPAGCEGNPSRPGLSIADLRTDIGSLVSLDAIAGMLESQPRTARNELRIACRKALTSARWDPLTEEEKQHLTEQLIDTVFGMGPIEALIADESVTEVMINGAREVFFERNGLITRSDVAFESDEQVRVLIDRVIGPLGRRIDESSPMVNARLPQGHRVNAVIPPITPDGPHLTIRAFGKRSLSLGEMVVAGSLSTSLACFLSWLVRLKKNVVVSGGTGSGKTTMLNALSHQIGPAERVITIEDSAELKLSPHAHVVRMEARPRNAEGTGEVTIRDLVMNALRMRPDRIIVGECRGGEAWDMLQAMSTGHDGSLTTLHANAPQDVIDRMVTMVRYAADLPIDAIEAQIGSAFDCIVHVTRDRKGHRYLSEIADVSFDHNTRRCVVTTTFARRTFQDEGSWLEAPRILKELEQLAEQDEDLAREVRSWERSRSSGHAQ